MLMLLASSSVKNHVMDAFKWVLAVLEGSSFLGFGSRAPPTLMCFQNSPISCKRKGSKLFLST